MTLFLTGNQPDYTICQAELILTQVSCGTGSTDVEGSHHSSNPILDGKTSTLNENDVDDHKTLLTFPCSLSALARLQYASGKLG